jgi:hypothetical protein
MLLERYARPNEGRGSRPLDRAIAAMMRESEVSLAPAARERELEPA